MLNITLFSLNMCSLVSMSPLFYVHKIYKDKVSTSIINSCFSRSFTNIIYSATNYHRTNLKNDEFSHILNGAIVFTSNDDITKDKRTIVKNKNISSHLVYNDATNNGDITIASCSFLYCKSTSGGAILIEQNCSVILHDSIFDHCTANDGAGAYICGHIKERSKDNGEIEDDFLTQVDIRYCCFQKCNVKNNEEKSTGFGSALILSGKNVALYFASSVNCPGHEEGTEKARGAQFDIHSDDVSSQFVNATGGYSKYCGSIEYRGSSKGFFQYQTIISMKCMFVVAFSKFSQSNTIEISYCNLVGNHLENNDESAGTYPALIHIRQQDIFIKHFAFINNNFGENGRIASKESQTSGLYPNQQINLVNCYADSYSLKEQEAFKTESCNFGLSDKITTNNISQLDLGECKGNVPPEEIIITSIFTPSNKFSKSDDFSKSNCFSNSIVFSQSSGFIHSNEFTKSKEFSISNTQIVPQESREEKKMKPGVISGIVAAAVAAVAIAALVAFFIIRKHKLNILNNEEIETIDSDQNSTNVDNPIFNQKADDDPFKEDFNN